MTEIDWANLFLLLALSAGNAEILVTLVNRSHALPLPSRWLKHIRHLHDVLIPAFPIALLWFVGWNGPELLRGGAWGDVPMPWKAYLVLCAAGFLGLLVSSIRHLRSAPPDASLSNHSAVVDVAAALGDPPLGEGPYRWLARFPANEICQVEFSEKTFTHPRLPLEWEGLSILHLSDWHFIGTIAKPFYEHVAGIAAAHPCDLAVFTGDLLDQQRLDDWIPDTLGQIHAPLGKFYILGNHDWYLDPPATRRRLDSLGWQDVASRTVCIEHQGRTLAIGGSELPWMGTHPDFRDVAADFLLFLCHTPDYFGWAQQQQVDLMLSGHNHGGQVVLPLVGPVYSPSRFGCRYAAGAFRSGPTLMHVSRGLSGRHPLRWRCRPEVTRIILRRPASESR